MYCGWRARIGLVMPGNGTNPEHEFHKYAPEGVTVVTQRVLFERVDPKGLKEMGDRVDEAAKLLATAHPDIILFGCTSGSLIQGFGYDQEIIKRIEDKTGIRALTTSSAVISALQRRAHLLDLLRQSIRERRFQVYYQPVQDLERGGFLTAEALVRLRDLDGTPVPPGEFIPLAEESGMIDKITWIVLEEVCRFLNTPEGQGLESVSVNLSMQQFADPSLAQRIHGIMAGHGVPHRRIKLEITERVLLNDREHMSAMMKEMSAQGFGFYLDDFGTGYSNLSSILDLPFEGIKLDKSIIDTFPANHRAATLVQACVALCHTFGTEIIVEGVETAEQADALARLGADRLQGYFYARPMPGEELAPLLPQGDRL